MVRQAAIKKKQSMFLVLAALLILGLFLLSCSRESDLSANIIPQTNAISGYDPVAYFTEAKPVPGQEDFSYVWNDAKWLFSSKENMELFQEAPERYAPQYNGYCAFALSRNDFVNVNPESWAIVDEKLYFTFNHDIKNAWLQDKRNYIAKANRNWKLRIDQESK